MAGKVDVQVRKVAAWIQRGDDRIARACDRPVRAVGSSQRDRR